MSAAPGKNSLISLLDTSHLRSAVLQRHKILLGVSGGADSVALLLAMKIAADRGGWEVAAVHINHGLRPESHAEARFAQEVCSAAGVQIYVHQLQNADRIEGGSAEAHWRNLRYRVFAKICIESKCEAIALGHNADDLAETFLFHLVRGTGISGLTFEFETFTNDLRILRPLWKTTRSQIESALIAAGQTWVEDPSNANVRHTRNLIRQRVMPLLREINPQASSAIVRASEAISHATGPAFHSKTSGVDGKPDGATDSSENPKGMLPLKPLHGNLRGRQDIAQSLRDFSAFYGLTLTGRQTDQASNMVMQGQVGLVSLVGFHTLVLTQEFAWILDRSEPSDDLLAQEHASRFGGLYAALPAAVQGPDSATNPANNLAVGTTSMVAIDGEKYEIYVTGSATGFSLRNKYPGDRLGSTPLKKLLNAASVPWYLRNKIVMIADVHNEIIGVVSDHAKLNELVFRKSRSPVQTAYQLARETNRA